MILKTFYEKAYEKVINLIPQYKIEKYIVDFLLLNGDKNLVIEIDGERYHKNWNGELCKKDQLRNQRLFELGYDVLRFLFYQVKDAFTEDVIIPYGNGSKISCDSVGNYFNLDLKPLLAERFYKVEVKVVSGSGTADEMINFYTEIPSFKVVK